MGLITLTSKVDPQACFGSEAPSGADRSFALHERGSCLFRDIRDVFVEVKLSSVTPRNLADFERAMGMPLTSNRSQSKFDWFRESPFGFPCEHDYLGLKCADIKAFGFAPFLNGVDGDLCAVSDDFEVQSLA